MSVSGTSLRVKDCRKVVSEAADYVPLPQHSENRIESLLRVFKRLMSREELSDLNEDLAHRAVEHYNNRPSKKESSDFLQGPDCKDIVGNFYFTKALRKAENESTGKLLQDSKTFLIPMLRSNLQRWICTRPEIVRSEEIGSIDDEPIEGIFGMIFENHHFHGFPRHRLQRR